MQITISGRNTQITDAIRAYTDKKIGKLTRYFDGITSCRVVLAVEGRRHTAEVELHVVKGGAIVALAESDDLYRSLDQVMSKLPRQLKRYKDKLHGKTKASGRTRAVKRGGRSGE